MDTLKPDAGRFGLLRLLGGIEAGVIGGSLMLAMLIVGSLWQKHPWWTVLNLLGSTFYGDRALRAGMGMATLAGAAFHLTACGLLGAGFGAVCAGVRPTRRLVLLGAMVGMGWYYVSHEFLWRTLNPLIPLYSPQPSTILAHLLLGVSLARAGRYTRPPAASPAGPAEPSGPAQPETADSQLVE